MNLTRRAYNSWTLISRFGIVLIGMIYRPEPRVVQRMFPMLDAPAAGHVRTLMTAVVAAGVGLGLVWLERRYVRVDGLDIEAYTRLSTQARVSRGANKSLLIAGVALMAISLMTMLVLLHAGRP